MLEREPLLRFFSIINALVSWKILVKKKFVDVLLMKKDFITISILLHGATAKADFCVSQTIESLYQLSSRFEILLYNIVRYDTVILFSKFGSVVPLKTL